MRLSKIINITSVVVLAGSLAGGAWYINEKNKTIDKEAPSIQIAEDLITCSITADNTELTEGVTATDNVDGDLSDQIIISGIQIKNKAEEDTGLEDDMKEFEITYVVFDSSNNMTSASRTLIYSDYYSPRFQLDTPLVFESTAAVKPLDFLRAEDCIDGNIGGQIALEMDPCNGFGTYNCLAKVTNSLGDAVSLPLTYQVVDMTSEEEQMKPSITLSDYIIYLQKGERFNPTDYLKNIRIDQQVYTLLDADKVTITEDTAESGYGYSSSSRGNFMLKDVITISSDVNTYMPGTYYVRYSFRHPVENSIGSADLMVIVE